MMTKKLKSLAIVVCAVLLVAVLASGCGGDTATTAATTAAPESTTTETAAPTPETVTITDGFGREVTIEKPLNTVVSGISITSEMLVSLGLGDHIIAIDRSTAAAGFIFPDLLSLPDVTTTEDNHYAVDYEAIIELDPDVFITSVVPQDGFDAIVAALEPEIPVIALSADTPEEIADSVTLLGELFDCQEAADEYIEFFKGTIDMISARTADIPEEDKPKVYYEWMPYYTFNKDLYMYQVQIDVAGGVNIAADMATTYGLIDPEWIIEKDPDVILSMALDYAYMGFEAVECGYEVDDYSSLIAYRESVMNRSEISDVTAVREGQVYVFHYNLSSISCIGYAYMAKWLHPDLFEDLDPQSLHQEWLTRFMGIDYDLEEHGVFVYPKQESEPGSVTITDATGREITLQLPIERVAYMHSTVAEGLRIIDAWDKVINRDNYTIDTVLFPGIEDLPMLTYSEDGNVDYEAVIELQPDVLLVLPSPGTIDMEEAIATLEPEIPVISVFDTYDSATWENGIALLGTIMQKEAEAQEFISFMQEKEAVISSRTAGLSEDEKPAIFIKSLGWTPEAFCSYSNEFAFVSKAMDIIGAVNIAADVPSTGGWIQAVDPEWLMTQEIDYIFVQVWDSFNPDAVGFLAEDESVMAGLREDIMGLLAFEDSKAVANGDVYMMDTYLLTTLRYPILMEYMAKMIHPDLFADLDPMATLQEYLERFIRIDHDLDESGVFFYPEN